MSEYELYKSYQMAEEEIADLKEEAQRLRGLLAVLYKNLEWCPVCDGMYLSVKGRVLHAPDCELERIVNDG